MLKFGLAKYLAYTKGFAPSVGGGNFDARDHPGSNGQDIGYTDPTSQSVQG